MEFNKQLTAEEINLLKIRELREANIALKEQQAELLGRPRETLQNKKNRLTKGQTITFNYGVGTYCEGNYYEAKIIKRLKYTIRCKLLIMNNRFCDYTECYTQDFDTSYITELNILT